MTKWGFRITARHLLDNLAGDLYRNLADSLWELVRNAVVACMPGTEWVPGTGHVEIDIIPNHPLAPKSRALVILDHGSGITEPSIKRYCHLGAALDDTQVAYSGAAQKRIGRFAAYALNRDCMEHGDVSTGFYILTRTSNDGPVTYVAMIPEEIEQEQGVTPQIKSGTCTELGPYKGIKGSFTAIVIPNPVFSSLEEIREALKYRLPRKPQQAFKLLVGGKILHPPKLESGVTCANDTLGIQVFVDKLVKKDEEGGIWLVDAHTGLRVAKAASLGTQFIPNPFFRPDLVGDIFIPNLLVNQDTSRSSLSPRFLRSKEWKKVTAYLVGQVAPLLKALLGDEDTFGKDAISKIVSQLADDFTKAFGPPDKSIVGPTIESDYNPTGNQGTGGSGSNGSGKGSGGHGGGGGGKPTGTPGGTQTKKRLIPVKIGDKTYLLGAKSDDDRILATVDVKGQVIWVNHHYSGLPSTQAARRQHFVDMLLQAVGAYYHKSSPHNAMLMVGELARQIAEK